MVPAPHLEAVAAVAGDTRHSAPPTPCRVPPGFADEPSIGETGCPARRLWVEGTAAELACAASGNPPPRVACAKLGDPQDPLSTAASPNVTRAHAGTYQCRATNAHGSALRNVTVAVECECGERLFFLGWGVKKNQKRGFFWLF